MGLRIALLAAIWIACGCSSSGSEGSLRPASVQPTEAPSGGPTAGPTVGPTQGPTASPGNVDLPASIVDAVVADIARIASLPVDQVTVVSAAPVTFPDGGLGCPEPGKVYIQVLVEGFRIVAKAGGTTYDYRGTGPDSFRRCTTGG
jgi:hypothetical protein